MLAVDRGNSNIAHLYRAFDPAVLRIIKHIIEFGHKEGVWVGMCGEMAGDLTKTENLLHMGVRCFSVSPHLIPELKEKLSKIVTINYAVLRVSKHKKAGKRTKYSVRAGFSTNRGRFFVKDYDWDVTKAMGNVLDKIERMIVESAKR